MHDRDRSQRGYAIQRAINLGTRGIQALLDGLVSWTRVSGYSTGADVVGEVTGADGEELTIVETYGLASRPPGAATCLVLAPGGDTSERVVIGSVSPAGRPETAAGDAVLWTAAGHMVQLENAGAVTLTSKDGSTITLDEQGSITLNVESGQSVNVGDALAEALVKSAPFKAAISAAWAAGAAVAPTPMAGNNGGLAFQAAQLAWDTALAGDPIDTTKAKGT